MFADEQRKKFSESRSPLSDAEFVAKLGLSPDLLRFAEAARHGVAKCFRVPASAIYPEDSPESLRKLLGDWDDTRAILEMESILGVQIGNDLPRFIGGRLFWRKWPGASSVGDWCRRVAEHINPSTQAPSRR